MSAASRDLSCSPVALGAADDLFVLHHGEHGEARRHGLRVRAEARGVHEDPVHGRVDLLEDPVPAERRADRHIAAGQRLRHAHQVRFDALLVLVGVEVPGPPEARLHLVRDEQRLVPVQQLLRGTQISGWGLVHALALDGLDDQPGDIPLLQLPGQSVQVTERNGGVGQQRGEAVAEAVLSVDGQ